MILLPLPAESFEEAFLARGQDDAQCSTKTSPSKVPMLSSEKKRSIEPTAISRTCRTGRWSSEESNLVDKLIKSFDAGLLPLPHGIKLNDFLCDLLSCRTSRLTKKLKHEKLSSRSYRSMAGSALSGGINVMNRSISLEAGSSIQRAQTLFLKTLSPSWLQRELRFNISRVWRTQLANLCLQVGFRLLDTTNWIASLNDVAQICSEDSLEAKRKRLKHALSEDASAAAKSGLDAENTISSELCSSQGNAEFGREMENGELQVSTTSHVDNTAVVLRGRFDSLDGSVARESETHYSSQRKFTFGEEEMQFDNTMYRVSSFTSLAALLTTPNASRRQSKADSVGFDDFPADEADLTKRVFNDRKLDLQVPMAKQSFDDVIESVVEDSFREGIEQGKFLQRVVSYIVSSDLSFQHADLWVPTECPDTGVINGHIRLTNAGHITVKSNKVPSNIFKRFNEFGVYSKNFAFSPGHGLPGQVFLHDRPIWMNKLNQAKPEQFCRVGGAKIYGVSTAVGMPVPTSIGNIVLVLYSTSDLPRDTDLESRCMDFFRQLRPVPKWRLCIDIACTEETEASNDLQLPGLAYAPRRSTACIVPSSPVYDSVDRASHFVNEQSLALLLGKIDFSGQGDDVAGHSMALRLLLLRHPSCRSIAETNQVNVIMSKYRSYIGAKRNESDIALLIANDWAYIAATASETSISVAPHHGLRNESYQVNGPDPNSFLSSNAFLPASVNTNSTTKGLEPRTVSNSTFPVQSNSNTPSPATFDNFDSV